MSVVLTEEMILTRSRASSLKDVKKLNYWASNLNDISILRQMPNIEILTLSVNNISTLKDLEKCTNLVELYIRNNSVSDLNDVRYLRKHKKLRILWLADNPCALDNDYRLIVLKALPYLSKLDNAVVTPEELEASKYLDYSFFESDTNEKSLTIESEELLTVEGSYEAVLTNLINDYDQSANNTNNSNNNNENGVDVAIVEEIKAYTRDTPETETAKTVASSTDQNDGNNDNSTIEENDVAASTDVDQLPELSQQRLSVQEERGQITRMSIDETNKLRLELGLKPLPTQQNLTTTHINQSPNVLAAALSLVKDLNVEGLEMVIRACQYRKELLNSIFYETS